MASTAALQPAGDGVAQLCAHLGPQGAPDGALGPALARLDFVAALPNPAAPAYVYFAGSCLGIAVGGGGATALEAAGRLAGEAAEVLSDSAAGDPETGNDGARTAVDLVDGRATELSAEAAAVPGSLGLAAGSDRAAARAAGLLELIERDAAARWWNDGTPPSQPDVATLEATAGMLATLRGPARSRATTLLALDGAAGIPVLCALSCDLDGRSLAFGLKAATDPAAAARGAVIECLQMEIALDLARLRAARGTPSGADAATLARAALDTAAFTAFAARPARPATGVAGGMEGIAVRLAQAGIRSAAIDLPGAPPGFTVSRVFAPGLRRLPGDRPAARDAPGSMAELM